jgi:tetratricopeptide (TPR) repeat protein
MIQFGQDSADQNALSWGLSRQGFAQRGLGQLDAAVDSLQQAMELADMASNYQLYVDCGGDLGQCYLRQGQYEPAFAVFKDCRRRAIENNLLKSPVTTRYRNGLAEALLMGAEKSEEEERDDYLKRARRACKEALKQGSAYPPGKPEAMMLRGRYEWLRGKQLAAEKWWQRSLNLAEKMNVRFDLGRTLLEMGQRLPDAGYLDRAVAIFTETNSQWELAKAQENLINLDSELDHG